MGGDSSNEVVINQRSDYRELVYHPATDIYYTLAIITLQSISDLNDNLALNVGCNRVKSRK